MTQSVLRYKYLPSSITLSLSQEEYVYDYQYADSGHNQDKLEDNLIEDDFEDDILPPVNNPVYDYPEEETVYEDVDNTVEDIEYTVESEDYAEYSNDVSVNENEDYSYDVDYTDEDINAVEEVNSACPGGDLESCVDVCPGQYGAKVFGLCVGSCGRRCP